MECQKINITPKVLSNFRSFSYFPREGKSFFAVFWFSPVREICFSLFFDFPPWGKVVFRCFLIFPREGNLFFSVFWFSPVRESRFSLFSCFPSWGKVDFRCFSFIVPLRKPLFRCFLFIVPLRKPLFLVFRSSYPYESFFFSFSVHRTPTKASFCRFSLIVPRIWVVFRKNWWLYPVYRQFFPKSEEKTISLLWNEFWNGLFLLVCFR